MPARCFSAVRASAIWGLMNRAMATFRRELLAWSGRIKRAGYLDDLRVVDLPNSEFRLLGIWEDGEYSRTYTLEYVLGRTVASPPLQQRPRYRVCWFRDEFVRGVLTARGV